MKRMAGMLALAALAMIGGAAAKGPGELSEKAAAKLEGFTPTGETVSCLSLMTIRSIDAIDDWRFLVRTNSGYYLNTTLGRCSGASRPSTRLQYTTSINQLCRSQIVNVIDNTSGFMTGSCGLGDFEKLDVEPEDAAAEDGPADDGETQE
ncbi:MAG: hypothetical protein R3C58_00125 [Parvularculaceae bacterium]